MEKSLLLFYQFYRNLKCGPFTNTRVSSSVISEIFLPLNKFFNAFSIVLSKISVWSISPGRSSWSSRDVQLIHMVVFEAPEQTAKAILSKYQESFLKNNTEFDEDWLKLAEK